VKVGKSVLLSAVIVISVLLLVNPYVYGGNRSGVSNKTVKIGIITDMTGPAAFYGKQTSASSRALFRSINDQGGINGRKIKYYIQDGNYDPVKTIGAAKYLISRYDIFALVNIVGSTPVSALFPLIAEEKIPVLPSMNYSSLMYNPFKRYLFHNITPAADQAIIGMDYILKNWKKQNLRVGVAYADDEMGKDYLKGVRISQKKYGFEIVGTESVKRGALDVSSQVLNLKRRNPDYLVMCFTPGPMAAVLKERDKINWPVTLVTSSIADVTIKLAGESAHDFYSARITAEGYENDPGVVELRKLVEKYEPKARPESVFIWAWTNNLVLMEGLKRAGRDLTREGLVDALETVKNLDTGGLIGPITYGPNDRNGTSSARMSKANMKKMRFDLLTGWTKPSIEE